MLRTQSHNITTDTQLIANTNLIPLVKYGQYNIIYIIYFSIYYIIYNTIRIILYIVYII